MIGLMDCNNFFVSCERLFRPDIRKKPVVVLSSNDGCVVARSQEVKDMGIAMGVPYFQVKDVFKEKGVTVFSSNFTLYRDISRRVMETLKEEISGPIQIYSIDEAFFSVPENITKRDIETLRERIIQSVGIPVSIGVADTKTIAKYAGTKAKKSTGVEIVTMDIWHKEVEQIPCGTIWGIGRNTAVKLRTLGILNVKDLLDIDMSFIKSNFGVVGERLRFELSGVQTEDRDIGAESNRSIMSSRSFKSALTDIQSLESAVAHHVIHIAEKLREQELLASQMHVSIRASRHGDYASHRGAMSIEFTIPSAETTVLLNEALRAVRALYTHGIPYKKVGVVVTGLMPEKYISGSLFSYEAGSDKKNVDDVVDAINKKFGRSTLLPAVTFKSDKWLSRSEQFSKEYTTKWTDIAHVKAV